MNAKEIIKQYTKDGLSCGEIAESLGTYSKKIERLLKKNGVELRSKSEAAKNAIKTGRSTPVNKGEPRSEKDKIAISKGVHKAWQNMSDEKREKFSSDAKERWDNMCPLKKREMQEKAGRALRKACIEGSKAEKFLKIKLEENGYDVDMHKKGLIE